MTVWIETYRPIANPESPSRVRKEEADVHNKDDMVVRHDSWVFRRHVLGPYLHHRHYHYHPDNIFQGGHRHRECPKQSQKSQVHKVSELVLPGDDHVLLIRRERYLLFQACPAGR